MCLGHIRLDNNITIIIGLFDVMDDFLIQHNIFKNAPIFDKARSIEGNKVGEDKCQFETKNLEKILLVILLRLMGLN